MCVIYLVLSLFGNISCRSNRNHQSLKHNMIPAKTHAKGLTVEIERDVWTSKYRRVSGPVLHGLMQWPLVWLQHCSEVTADPVTPGSAAECCIAWHCSECEDGSSPVRWHRGQLNRLPSKHQHVLKSVAILIISVLKHFNLNVSTSCFERTWLLVLLDWYFYTFWGTSVQITKYKNAFKWILKHSNSITRVCWEINPQL